MGTQMRNNKRCVLVTGAGSYIGRRFIADAQQDMLVHEVSVRGDQWKHYAFRDHDTVLHVAGIAHTNAKNSQRNLYYEVNTDLTLAVAEHAKNSGVKQFIFMSSMIVYGETPHPWDQTPITAHTAASPHTAYGDSKLQAEKGLLALADDNFKVAIIRTPLVYGTGSKGNFQRLLTLAALCPVFPNISSRRSIIHIGNLTDFLKQLVMHQDHGIYFPQDAEYLNSSQAVSDIRTKLGKKTLLTRSFNPAIKLVSRWVAPLRKLFGTMYYDQSLSTYRDNSYRKSSLRQYLFTSINL